MGFVEGIDVNQPMIIALDDMVSKDSIARVIDVFVDGLDLEALGFTGATPPKTGRPPYHSAPMTKLYLYGYEEGIRSSRRLERETHRNVEVMWLMRGLKPDFKTIAEFRRKNIEPLQKGFYAFVDICNQMGLIGGKVIAIDGTKIKASNNKKKNYNKKKLEQRIKEIDEYLRDLDAEDREENPDSTTEPKDVAGKVSQSSPSKEGKRKELQERKEKYEGYLKQLEESGENEISVVDPDARLMGNNRAGVDMAYNVQSAVDSKHHLVVEYNVTTNPSDHYQLSEMVKNVQRRLRLKKFIALADKGYYNGEDLARVKKLKVKAIVARQNPSNPKKQSSEFHTDKFIYDSENDKYICPMGKILHPHNKKTAQRRKFYNKTACSNCPYVNQCTNRKGNYRTISRSKYADIYEETDRIYRANTELYKQRQMIVEHPFGTIKRTMNGYYFLLRTRRKVCGEVALLNFGYNLKRAIKVLGFDEFMKRLKAFSGSLFPLMGKFLEKSLVIELALVIN